MIGFLVGCSGPDAPTGEPSSAVGERAAKPNEVERPFAALRELGQDQQRLLHDASELVTADCMRERGFQYTPREYVSTPVASVRIGDVEYAKRMGFGTTEDSGLALEDVGESDDLKGLAPDRVDAWQIALGGEAVGPDEMADSDNTDPNLVLIDSLDGDSRLGFRADSCASIGLAAVYGDIKEWSSVEFWTEDLVNQVGTAVQGDSRWLDREQEWKQCMTDRGFGSQSRLEHSEELSAQAEKLNWSDSELLAKEIPVATASAECEDQLDMAALYRTLQDEHESQIGDANEGIIIRFLELQQAALDRSQNTEQR